VWTDPDLQMSPRAIAALAGWKVSTDAAFARAGRKVRHLRVIEGMAA
jgi:hypothetical protein